jgi:hypothetical protein
MAAFTPAFLQALSELGTSIQGPITLWDDDKLDIEPDAVRPQPKRVDMRGFGEVEL